LEEAAKIPNSDFKIFGKPTSRPYRRMGIGLAYDTIDTPIDSVRARAAQVANLIQVNGLTNNIPYIYFTYFHFKILLIVTKLYHIFSP
jgi:hypothetical protein